jgi:hypothetical protein
VTFAFFTQIAEYAITARETDNAAQQYYGVGSAEVAPVVELDPSFPNYINVDPRIACLSAEETKMRLLDELRYQPLTQEQISSISKLQSITSTSMRFMTDGISSIYYRLDDGEYFYNYSARCVVEATLSEVKYGELAENPAMMSVNDNCNRLILDDLKLLAGNSKFDNHDKLTVYAYPLKPDGMVGVGGAYKRTTTILTSNYIYDTEYINTLVPGSRYVFILRYEPLDEQCYYLGDHLTNSWCEAVQSIDSEYENYIKTDKFEPLRELIEITNSDIHTFDVVYADDMSAIMRFAEGNMAITSGRPLTNEDSENGLNICVVSHAFAEAYELQLGSTITLKLGTELFEQYKGLGAIAATRERYKPPRMTTTFEIVGIYIDTDSQNMQKNKPNWCYSVNTVFVPKSLLPVDGNTVSAHVFSPSEFSFKIENAWDIQAFTEEGTQMFDEMGLRLIFDDAGWPNIAKEFRQTEILSLISISVFSVTIVAAIWFSVYLFVGRKKKEYAVMRALGTTKKMSARTLIFPFMMVAAPAVLAGSFASWLYTVGTVGQNSILATLEEYSVNSSVPAWAAVGCILGELLLALFFSSILLRYIGSHSPLSLLNSTRSVQKHRRRGK